jgi:hypothetical protein
VPAPTPVSPARTARIIHLALTVPPIVFGSVVALIVARGALPPAGNPMVHFALVGIGLLLMLAGTMIAFRIPARSGPETPDAYWGRTFPRAVVAWAMMEGGAFLMAFAGLFSGTILYPVIGMAAFAALMVGFAPSRISGG